MMLRSAGMGPRLLAAPLAILLAACQPGATGTPIPSGAPIGTAATPTAPSSATPPTTVPTRTPGPTRTDGAPLRIAGTITWQTTTTTVGEPVSVTEASGSLDLELEEDLGAFTAIPGGGSTYEYDVTETDIACTRTAHPSGTLETTVGGFDEAGDGVGTLLVFSSGINADFEMSVNLDDVWDSDCSEPPGGVIYEFNGCADGNNSIQAIFDGVGSYTVSCDITGVPGVTMTGHIEGTLSPAPLP
ncbi:MAG: hypothetical protein ABIZ34_07110 [Candidatus Limnocylindrales bacterium]